MEEELQKSRQIKEEIRILSYYNNFMLVFNQSGKSFLTNNK